jgi:hypothetical protein
MSVDACCGGRQGLAIDQCEWSRAPGPWRCPWWEKPRDGGDGVVEAGRPRLVAVGMKTRDARAPSAGHVASRPASLIGRDTSNVTPHRSHVNA